MVLDTDTYNEIDDHFAVVYSLMSPEKLDVEAIYAAPIFRDFFRKIASHTDQNKEIHGYRRLATMAPGRIHNDIKGTHRCRITRRSN